MRKTKNYKKIFFIGFAIYLYMAVVVIYAMPLHYGTATVYNTNPIEIIIKKEVPKQVVKPPVVQNLPVLKVENKTIAYYKEVAEKEAENHDLDAKMFKEIINCESGFDPKADHDGGNGKGITGFWRETFARWNKQFFNGELDYNKQEDQIKLMARAFQEGEEYRNDWSSWNKYKKYGVCFNYQIRKIQANKNKNG